jgi:hypothetical protein
MKKITILLFLFLATSMLAQIRGKITDTQSNSLSFVSVYLNKTARGTTSNDNGNYVLKITKKGSYTVVFQFLGYKTVQKEIEISSFPFELNVQLEEENVQLSEITISTKENPANAIIRNAIANKDKNTEKLANYSADFYSRGIFKIKNAPKKFLGQELGDLGGGLDSTRTGIVSLSETVSKIDYQKKPKEFKEFIVASKVSGDDKGISFNQAADVNFNLYENQVTIAESKLFSPIANSAFSYYKFKLEGSFYDADKKLINKIKLIPKVKNSAVFGGYLYIVEDSWAIYGADITATGGQVGIKFVDVLHIKQNYNFDVKTNSRVLILQTIDFKAGMFGFKMNGRFSASYSNYNFKPNFNKNTFGKEVLSFAENATKKDSVYWNKLRSVPLTLEETKDYKLKDSIKIIRKSKKYLDSIDNKRNRFKLTSPILGYTKRNSFEKWRFNYSGLIEGLNFNTIQGFNTGVGFRYLKRKNDKGNWWRLGTTINYGLSDKRIRPVLNFTKKWNSTDRSLLRISAGITSAQFDERNPISYLDNTIFSLLYKENYAKFYQKEFSKISFSKEVSNGVLVSSSLEYANRKPLFNTTDYSFFKTDRAFTTNNPINNTSNLASFKEHTIATAQVVAQINFGNKYLSYPNFKFNIPNKKYPTLILGVRKTFGAKDNNLNSDFLFTKLYQNISLAAMGEFKYNTRAGMFLKQKDIAFMDYYHPTGNETILASENRLSSFNLLPFYQLSTNDKYTEIHTEHNFKGFLMNKIPLLNKLNFHLVGSAKGLFTAARKPYTEYAIGLDNIGFGKWRFLRVDYVCSNFGGVSNSGFVFGLRLFD